MFLFYVLSFFKEGDTIQEGTLFKEMLYKSESCSPGHTDTTNSETMNSEFSQKF